MYAATDGPNMKWGAGHYCPPRWRRPCVKYSRNSSPVNSSKIMGVESGGKGVLLLDFEIWHFSITFLAKKVVFLVSRRKNEISSLLPSLLERFLWWPVEKSANASPPWKKSFRCPCVKTGLRVLVTSRTVSKVSGTKDDDIFLNGFSSVSSASASMSSCTFRYQNAKTRQSICSKLSAKMPTVLRMQCKTKTQLKLICHMCHFEY